MEQRGIEPLTSALRMGLDNYCMVCHAATCSGINLQFFNWLQPSQDQLLMQSFDMEFYRFASSPVNESVTFSNGLAYAFPLMIDRFRASMIAVWDATTFSKTEPPVAR